MRKMFIILLLTTGVISACTVEDVADNVVNPDNANVAQDGTSQQDSTIEKYDFVITPANVTGDFRTFFQNIVSKHSNILIKDGTYEIELVNSWGVRPQNGCTITFEENAKIKVKPNKLDFYSVIDLTDRKNVTIKNPNLEGDKHTHLGKTGQWGHGINIVDCSNITIHDAYATKFWGDGIYLRDCENIRIYNAHLVDNRRQGMSITSGNDIEIHNLIVENTGGTNPGCGIDIEPNWNRNHITKLRIYKPTLRNNGLGNVPYPAGISFSAHSVHLLNPNKPEYVDLVDTFYDIEIFDPVFEGDALMISAPSDYAKGSIKVHNPIFYNSKRTALYISNHQSDFFKTEIINPKFIDCVEATANRHSVYLSPILFTCYQHLSHKNVGNRNITITNPTIEASNNAKYKIAAIRNSTTNEFKDDLNNVVISGVSSKGYEIPFFNYAGASYLVSTNINPKFSLTFRDKEGLPALPATYGSVVSKMFDGGAVNYTLDANSSSIYIIDDIPISDFEFYYVNNSKDKSALKLLFGTKSEPNKVFISRWSTERMSGIEIPYGGFVKMKKSRISSQGVQHWTVIEASSSVKGIN